MKIPYNELYEAYLIASQERYKYKEILDKIKKNNQRIIDYGFDYDGYDSPEELKKLIDELVKYAEESKKILKGE